MSQDGHAVCTLPRLMYRDRTKQISHAVLLPHGLLYRQQENRQFTLFATKRETLGREVHSAKQRALRGDTTF